MGILVQLLREATEVKGDHFADADYSSIRVKSEMLK